MEIYVHQVPTVKREVQLLHSAHLAHFLPFQVILTEVVAMTVLLVVIVHHLGYHNLLGLVLVVPTVQEDKLLILE
jgi:hypothetical protein